MSDTKFTPGPWAAVFGPHKWDAQICAEIDSREEEIALLTPSNGADEPTFFPFKENAFLMAAAPDMFDALVWALDMLQELGVAYAPGDAALAKARGEQP